MRDLSGSGRTRRASRGVERFEPGALDAKTPANDKSANVRLCDDGGGPVIDVSKTTAPGEAGLKRERRGAEFGGE